MCFAAHPVEYPRPMKNMILSPSMSEPLNRLTLSAQVAALMRKAIQQRTWIEYLPSERRLCEYFQVSRPTIRVALQTLAREGEVEIRHGRRVRLLGARRVMAKPQNRFVGIVTQIPVSQSSATSQQVLSELRAQLAAKGVASEVYFCPRAANRGGFRMVEDFLRQNRVTCCVVAGVSEAVQQWFARRAIPALILGSCHEAVRLPSLDVDYRSVCRHAAGILFGKGHRKIALVVMDSGLAGDLASEQGFREGVASHLGSGGRAKVVRHSGNAQNITAKLDELFKSADAPTALLVARPRDVFAVIIYLLRSGLAVPDAVSLIARDQDDLFEAVDPLISHYRLVENAYVPRLSRLLLKLMSEGYLPPEPTFATPAFFTGGTLRRPKLDAMH